jgi:hypothetical protein
MPKPRGSVDTAHKDAGIQRDVQLTGVLNLSYLGNDLSDARLLSIARGIHANAAVVVRMISLRGCCGKELSEKGIAEALALISRKNVPENKAKQLKNVPITFQPTFNVVRRLHLGDLGSKQIGPALTLCIAKNFSFLTELVLDNWKHLSDGQVSAILQHSSLLQRLSLSNCTKLTGQTWHSAWSLQLLQVTGCTQLDPSILEVAQWPILYPSLRFLHVMDKTTLAALQLTTSDQREAVRKRWAFLQIVSSLADKEAVQFLVAEHFRSLEEVASKKARRIQDSPIAHVKRLLQNDKDKESLGVTD